MTVDELIGILGRARNRFARVLVSAEDTIDLGVEIHRTSDLTKVNQSKGEYPGCFLLMYKIPNRRKK